MTPVVSAASCAQAEAISRRSDPSASIRARTPPSLTVRPAARNSSRTKSIRSDTLVILGHSNTRAPFPARPARSALPLAPPAWVTTRRTSGGGSAASRASSSATSLPALCASRITTTQPPPNREGAVSVAERAAADLVDAAAGRERALPGAGRAGGDGRRRDQAGHGPLDQQLLLA